YLRRALRIFPPMYVILAVASVLCLVGALEGSLELDAVLAQVMHLSNYYIIAEGWWDGRAPGTWVYWSLAVEEHFYLVFPVFYLALLRLVPSRRRQMVLLLTICALTLAWRFVLVLWLDASKDRTYIATDARVDSILFGCVLAIYGNPALDQTRLTSRWLKFFWLPMGVMGLVLSIGIRQPQFQETLRYTMQGIALVPLFIVAVRYPDWAPCRLLNLTCMKFIGALSYSVYLMHTTVLFAVDTWTPWHPILKGTVSLGVSLLLATAMFYGIEKPCAELRKRLSGSRRRRQQVAVAPPLPLPLPVPALAPAPALPSTSWVGSVSLDSVSRRNGSASPVGAAASVEGITR
ncbi:MAG: acyltransferase family protein, partial [Chloroflexota bacterium]